MEAGRPPHEGERPHHGRERDRQGARCAIEFHENSPRAGAPFVKLHCASLAETILESELFGHEKGSLHGLIRPARRAVQAGRRGARSFSTRSATSLRRPQVKLLRFLQERTFERVGRQRDAEGRRAHHRRDQPRPSSGSLARRVSRRSLLPGLNVVNIEMPPLRAAPERPLAARHAFSPPFLERERKANRRRR